MATVESIAIVTAVEPLKLVPLKPVPIVNVLVVFAVIVAEPPNAIAVPLTVIDVFANPTYPLVTEKWAELNDAKPKVAAPDVAPDVVAANPLNGSMLVYDISTLKWYAKNEIENQTVDGGNF